MAKLVTRCSRMPTSFGATGAPSFGSWFRRTTTPSVQRAATVPRARVAAYPRSVPWARVAACVSPSSVPRARIPA
eukprot:485520-Rhodomonas_salina.2